MLTENSLLTREVLICDYLFTHKRQHLGILDIGIITLVTLIIILDTGIGIQVIVTHGDAIQVNGNGIHHNGNGTKHTGIGTQVTGEIITNIIY